MHAHPMTLRDDVHKFERSAIGELFTRDAAYIRDLVCRAFSGELTPEELTHHQMLWYSIATTARFYAFTSGSGPCDIDLKWAELANMTYGHLSSLPGRDYMMPSWMGLKVRLISCLGSAAPKSLADPLEVVEWFRGCLTVSCADARRVLAGAQVEHDQDAAAAIERIREAVRLVGPLRHTAEFRACPEVQQWLELFRNDAEG